MKTIQEFYNNYTPITNNVLGKSDVFHPFGKQLDFVLTHSNNYIWTLLKNHDGGIALTNGLHTKLEDEIVGYIITKEEWKNPISTPIPFEL